MLTSLPDLHWPITRAQSTELLRNVAQLNLIYGALDERTQKALSILFKIYQLRATPGGNPDYTGEDGFKRLFQDSEALVGEGTGISTRVGDLRAAGLAIDFSDTQAQLSAANLPPLPADVGKLRGMVRGLAVLSPRKLDEISLMLSYIRKESFGLDRPASDSLLD